MSDPRPELDLELCRVRQHRLLQVMQAEQLDAVVLTRLEMIQWLVGHRFGSQFASLATINAQGHVTLIAPHKEPERAAADTVVRYDAKWLSTMRNDQMAAASEVLDATLNRPGWRRIGVEYGAFPVGVAQRFAAEFIDVDAALYQLRRRKEADELSCLRFAISATEPMYRRARQIIRPGVTEIEVFNELQTIAVEVYDEPLTGTGNDYQCGSRGGPPRSQRPAQSGELYILDLGPAYRGYFADNARTIAVDSVSDEQHQAWAAIQPVFELIENQVAPGVSCRNLFEQVQQLLDQAPSGVFNHHLGHGIGLAPHEGPHLNPNWDDVFEVGDVFTAEPGLYDAEKLRHGMRLENDYLVTETGVELLTPFPMGLDSQ